MLNFYDVDPTYASYLRQFDSRIPNIVYDKHRKFVCGIVLTVDGHKFFAPISSNTTKQQTCILIQDDAGRVLSSIKFSFMFPVPDSALTEKDFAAVRTTDAPYADLLAKEIEFCRANEDTILAKAKSVYKIGCNPDHVLHKFCCDFALLQEKHDEWLTIHQK